jgi:hypothetical protein
MIPELLHGVQARVGDAGSLQPFDDLRDGKPREHRFDQRVHLGAMCVARAAAGVARVARQLGLFEHLGAEARELALVLYAQEHRAVAGAERPVRHDGGVEGAGARRRCAAIGGEVGRERHSPSDSNIEISVAPSPA